MSSQLYKVLDNIENGRQKIRKELKLKGLNVEENANLHELASDIAILDMTSVESEEDMET